MALTQQGQPSSGAIATKKSLVIGTFFGLLSLSIGCLIILMDIQTSEAFLIQGTTVNLFHPNLQIAMQPYLLFVGNLDLYTAKSVIWGWGLELTQLICVIGWGVAKSAIAHYNPKLVGWFRTGAIALSIFNGITSFGYGNLASGFWGQAGFALLCALGASALPMLGTYMLVHTWSGPASSIKKSPIPGLVLGAAAVAFGVCIVLMEIQTSEAFILHQPVTVFHNNWSTLQQPYNFINGTLSVAMAQAVVWGWVIETIYFVCVVGGEVASSAFGYHNPSLAKWLIGSMIILVGFNVISNLFYGTLPSGLLGQIGFSLMTTFGSAFFLIVGTYLIEYSLTGNK